MFNWIGEILVRYILKNTVYIDSAQGEIFFVSVSTTLEERRHAKNLLLWEEDKHVQGTEANDVGGLGGRQGAGFKQEHHQPRWLLYHCRDYYFTKHVQADHIWDTVKEKVVEGKESAAEKVTMMKEATVEKVNSMKESVDDVITTDSQVPL